MSIYIIKHKNKYYLYHLRDEYHHTLLSFWKNNRTTDTIEIPDSLKKGIKHAEIIDVGAFDTPFNVAERYQSKVCIHAAPLWWHLDTDTMKYGLIPQY